MEEKTVKNLNVGLIGLAFLLIITGFLTMSNVQPVILDSARNVTSDGFVAGFSGDGFVSVAIVYAVFTLANFFAPSVVSVLGPRFTMIVGGIGYVGFIAQLLYPNNILLYVFSALLGFGAALIWVGQGNFLTLNSDKDTMERNSGIFLGMMYSSNFIGNTFVYIVFRGVENIDSSLRTLIASVLLSITSIGVLTFFFLRPTPWASKDSAVTSNPTQMLKASFKLIKEKKMLLLVIPCAYTGLTLTFWSGVYGTCLGRTNHFGKDAKSLVGLHGIISGLGLMIGSLAFGMFGKYLDKYIGRSPRVVFGFVLHIITFIITLINLPFDSTFGETSENAVINPNTGLAMFASFLVGFGDACFNTQIYALLGNIYSDNSAPAFAIFKFFQSGLSAVSFVYSSYLSLPWQLLLLGLFSLFGTISFVLVDNIVNKTQV